MNSLHLIGRLTKDVELQPFSEGDGCYCSFVIAVDRKRSKNAEGQTADFPRLTAFGKTAENMAKYLKKGSLVSVEGQVRTDNYEKEGKQLSRTELIANSVEFLSSGNKEAELSI